MLALLRSRTAENVLEAKALLEKLFNFQVGGRFPYYLHEYPECHVQPKLSSVVFFILKEYQPILGKKNELEKLLIAPVMPKNLHLPEEWAEFLIYCQITGESPQAAFQQWDPKLLSFVGQQRYEKGEPAVTLYDLFLGEWGGRYSTRALQDHPAQLRGGLVYPGAMEIYQPESSFRYAFWGDGYSTHSLVLETKGEIGNQTVFLSENEVHDEVEVAYFCSLPNEILVDGKKATSFQLGQTIQIGKQIELEFTADGDGQYWGHLYRGNRSGQLIKDDAYDSVIALRTVKRSLSSTIKIRYRVIDDRAIKESTPRAGD